MSNDLILVIDMQNVYAEGGQWRCEHTEEAAKHIQQLLKSERVQRSADIMFTKFLAPENPRGDWKKYNIENAEVNEDPYANSMLELFSEDIKKYPLYAKSTYSSLTIPEVFEAALQAKQVVVSGVVAECCVLATVMALIDAGVHVVYLTDAVAGINSETEKAVELILSGIEPLQVQRMTTEKYIESITI